MLARLKLNWQNIAIGGLTLLLSLCVWVANDKIGHLEAAELDIAGGKVHMAVLDECIMEFRKDNKEILDRVKHMEQLLMERK